MKRATLAVAAILVASAAAQAHAPKVGHNGGPQTNAGNYHLEIVPEGTTLTVYLRSHADKAVPTQGVTGTASFTVNGKAERIPLAPGGDNKLIGTSPVPLPSQPKGAVEIAPAAGGSVVGRF